MLVLFLLITGYRTQKWVEDGLLIQHLGNHAESSANFRKDCTVSRVRSQKAGWRRWSTCSRCGEWLKEKLETLDGPIIVASHQPLAGAYAVDNAEEIQTILGNAASKVILVINGHSHIDEVVRVKNVTYMHVNSASYKWVGGNYRHESYSKEIHEKHPSISYTCPYRDSLFTTITVDPGNSTIHVKGCRSSWVGKSPAELGLDMHPGLTNGEEIAPRIRDRKIVRVSPSKPPD